MELFDRYVNEVGKELPRHLRTDVVAELRSLLQDQLEERAAESGRAPDEALAIEVLAAMGKPDQVATRYLPPRWLIGPRLYPTFLGVLKVVLLVLLAWLAFWAFFATGMRPGTMPELFSWHGPANFLAAYAKLALVNAGILVLVFALIERLTKPEVAGAPSADRSWDPRTLPKLENRDRISRAQLAWRIYVLVTLLILGNVLPAAVAVTIFSDDFMGRIPMLLPAFQQHLPGLNLWWAAALALNISVLALGRWTPKTRWFEFGLGVIAIVLLYRLASGPAFIGIPPDWIAEQAMSDRHAESLAHVSGLLWRMFRLGTWICMWICVIEAVARLSRLVSGRAPVWYRWMNGGSPAI